MYRCFVCMCIWGWWYSWFSKNTQGVQNRSVNLLKLDLQMVRTIYVHAGNPPWGFRKNNQCSKPLSHLSRPSEMVFKIAALGLERVAMAELFTFLSHFQ